MVDSDFRSHAIQCMVFAATLCSFFFTKTPSSLLTPLLLQEALQPATGSHVVWVLQLSGEQEIKLRLYLCDALFHKVEDFRQVSTKLLTGQ